MSTRDVKAVAAEVLHQDEVSDLGDPAHRAHVAERIADALAAETPACECPPCPGRGNDGHGMTHCAECCFGTGVEADLDCPAHGIQPAAPADGLTDEEQRVLVAVVDPLRLPTSLVEAVELIVAARVAAARADERERITAAVESVLARWSRPSLHDAAEKIIRQVRAALAQPAETQELAG